MPESKIQAGTRFKKNAIRTVLIALDYEPSAQQVAEVGYGIAVSLGASVVLMHVVAENVYYATPDYSPVMGFTGFGGGDITSHVGSTDLNVASHEYLNVTKHHLGDDTIQTMVVEGDTAESILNAAIAADAGLIVMGSHSRRGLDRVLMGNIAEDVLKKVTLPLLVIPTHSNDKS
jgi:nucleotide-binding universal stress UspA family protein